MSVAGRLRIAGALGLMAGLESGPMRSPIVRSEFIYTTAPYPQAPASTIGALADGTIAAAWFAGTGEGDSDVAIWFARRGSNGWQTPVVVADGVTADGRRFPTSGLGIVPA